MKASTQFCMAQQIRDALKEEGITQAEFARRVGCSQKHLSLVLNGKAGALPATLDYWAFVIGRRWEVQLTNGPAK